MAAAAMPLEGDPAAYATVEMRYRSPAYLPLCPPGTFDSNAQRATIPSDLPGAGTPTNEIKTALTPVVMLDGRKLLAAGERPHIDRHGFIYAQRRRTCLSRRFLLTLSLQGLVTFCRNFVRESSKVGH